MKNSFLRERSWNTIMFLLNGLQAVHPWALSWWDSGNKSHRTVCKRLGANLSLLSASFIERAVPLLPNGGARADVVLGVLADMLEQDGQWYDPEAGVPYVPRPNPDPEVLWVGTRYRDWTLKKLHALKSSHPGVIDWWDETNSNHRLVATRVADHLTMLLGAFLRKTIGLLPNPGARADAVLPIIAARLRISATAWDPESENTIPE